MGVLALQQPRDEGAKAIDHAPQIDAEDLLPVTPIDLPQRSVRGTKHASVKADQVDRAERLLGGSRYRFAGNGIGHIEGRAANVRTARERAHRGVEPVSRQVSQDHGHGLSGKPRGQGQADAARSSRHHRNTPCKWSS